MERIYDFGEMGEVALAELMAVGSGDRVLQARVDEYKWGWPSEMYDRYFLCLLKAGESREFKSLVSRAKKVL